MQEGGQMAEEAMAQPQQESVDPAIQQISDFISQSIGQGQNPAEVVMSLVQQQVDQQTIGQALMMNGFEEDDIMALFQELSQGQQVEEQVGGEPDLGNLNQTPEELTQDTRMHADDMSAEETDEPGMALAKSGIEIKPENEGKFTRWAEARGMSVQEAANKVMSNTDEYPPAVVKMANFAKNAAGWNKEYGGEKYNVGGATQDRISRVNNVSNNPEMHWQRAPLYMNPMAFQYSNDNFSLGKAAAVAYGGYKEFLSGKENEQGVKEGFFRDTRKKAGLRDAAKGDYYNYKITQDPNDPNKYMADNLDLYNASRNKGSLRTPEQYVKDIAANSRFNYNTDTHDYDFITSSRPIDKRIYDSAGQKNALKGKDYNYLLNMDPDTKAMILGGKDDPEGVRMGIDEYGRGMSYLPGAKNPYEYNTYMGINKVGQSSMIPVGDNGQPTAAMTNTPAIPGIPSSMRQQTDYNADTQAVKDSQLQKRFPGLGPTPEQQRQSMFGQQQSNYDALRNLRFKYGGNLSQAQDGDELPPIPYSNEYLDSLEKDYLKMYNDPNTEMDDGYDKFYHSLIDHLPDVTRKTKGWLKYIPGEEEDGIFIEEDAENTTAPLPSKKKIVKRVEDYEISDKPDTSKQVRLAKYIQQRAINKLDNRSVPNNRLVEQRAYGGDLYKAQVGLPANFDPNDPYGLKKKGFGQTANYADTTGYTNGQPIRDRSTSNYTTPGFVEGMGIGEDGYGGADNTRYDFNVPNTKNPNIDYDKLNNFSIGPGVNDNASLSYGDPYAKDGVNFEMPTETVMTPADQYGNGITPNANDITSKPAFGQPKVERTNKFEGGLNRLADSRFVQGYGKLSNFAVQAAGVVNDIFADKAINDARESNFNKLGADYQYATAEDPFNKRGLADINTGTFGSEGDRTVGLYMNAKYGGENKTIEVDSNLLAKLIAAGADIEIL